MWTAQFWKDAGERALKTFAQALIAVLGAGAVDLMSVGWKQDLSVAGGAALLSLLTSIGSAKVGEPGSPSLVKQKE